MRQAIVVESVGIVRVSNNVSKLILGDSPSSSALLVGPPIGGGTSIAIRSSLKMSVTATGTGFRIGLTASIAGSVIR